MRSLSNALTHSVSYINTFKNNNEKHINDIKKIYDDIIDMDTSDEDYIGTLREKIDKFKDDYDKEIKRYNELLEVFIEDLEFLAKNRNDELVIYSMDTFAKNEHELSKSIKDKSELVRFQLKLEASISEAKHDNEFLLSIALNQIKIRYDDILANIKKVASSLNKITQMKDKEDDKD